MSNNKRVFNVTRRFYLKHKQAESGVANFAFAWVEYGVTVRDLSPAESVAARKDQAGAPRRT